MFDFTPEERKVILFFLALALGGLILSSLIKVNSRIAGVVYPQAGLAKLDLNKAGLAELISTRRVSLKLAQRILEYRNLRREFSSLEELKEVKGIGEERYGKLKELFFVE
jgi:competence ComEA-like helix-hairpin-helix protein